MINSGQANKVYVAFAKVKSHFQTDLSEREIKSR